VSPSSLLSDTQLKNCVSVLGSEEHNYADYLELEAQIMITIDRDFKFQISNFMAVGLLIKILCDIFTQNVFFSLQ
jgi:hypothetical protein